MDTLRLVVRRQPEMMKPYIVPWEEERGKASPFVDRNTSTWVPAQVQDNLFENKSDQDTL
jgi:hypothetical protein